MRRAAHAAALASVACLLASGCSVFGSGHPARRVSSPTPTPVASRSGRTPVPPLSVALPGIEAFVENERGLQFKHAVSVRLLGHRAFVAKLHHSQGGPPTPAEVEQLTSTLAALGLISPRLDVVKAFTSAYDAGTLGFYDFKDKRLYVRGIRATPGVRAVLAHELTHALDDQWFHLDRPALSNDRQEKELAFTALSEGDAERTRIAYERQMTPADRKAATAEENAQSRPPKVPDIVLELIGFPYAVGPQFVDALVAEGGTALLNRAFRHPPVSSEQLLDPEAYLTHDQPVPVATPGADGVRVDHGDLGLIGLLLTLEHRLGRTTAQQAVTGWGGDQYVTWRAGDHRWCLRDTVVMDYRVADTLLDRALALWVAKSHGTARIEQTGTRTTFVSCSG